MFRTLQHTIHLTTTRPRYFMRVSEFFLSSDKILVNSRRGNRPMWSETLRRQHPLQFFRTSFSDFYSIKNWFLVLFFSVILLTEKRRENFFFFFSQRKFVPFFLDIVTPDWFSFIWYQIWDFSLKFWSILLTKKLISTEDPTAPNRR